MNYSALIVAAGNGTRMGLGYNKLLHKLANGKTILETTLQNFQEDEHCSQIVVVVSLDDMETMMHLCAGGNVVFVAGGGSRQESVYHGLLAIREDHVLIHDGSRPWLNKEDMNHLLDCLAIHKACLCMIPVKDTIKVIKQNKVLQTLNASELWVAQTPQGFDTHLILSCYRKAMMQGIQASDDSQIVEKCSDEEIYIVKGNADNVNITTSKDIHKK